MPGSLIRSAPLAAVRKDASGTPAPEAAAGPKVYKFIANDARFDRYNDRNKVEGWKLDNFNANPVILFNHDDGSGGMFAPPTPTLPIGKGFAYVESDALMVDIEFDQDDEFARRVESKVEKGILNAVSVRYRLTPGKYKENERGGIDSDEQELLEISVVNLPGHQGALRVKALEADERAAFVGEIAKAVADLLDARAKSAEPSEEPPAIEPKAETTTCEKHPDVALDEQGVCPACAEEAEPKTAPVPENPELSEESKSTLADAVLKHLKEMTSWS